jgi:putative PIN family toxin of toxin-antitoxin system
LRRIIIDAGNLVSGSANPHPESPSWLLFNELGEMRFETVICPRILAEITGALRKPYFRKRVNEQEITEITTAITEAGIMFADPVNPEPVIVDDPKDDYLVALARTTGAEFIVSGDKHLLGHIGLEPPAVNARSACELLGLIELR